MIADELKYRIRSAFGYEPTAEQQEAMNVFATFMADRGMMPVMVMRGSAGTGKTTLAAAIVKAMLSMGQQLVLMAPTGRAAKVFSQYAGTAAYTIHRRIYRQKSLEGGFELNYNNAHDTLFIVDEASMISLNNEGRSVLDDLISFVYNGRNCRLMLIGDQAQLPPVGEEESPALMASVLRSFCLHVYVISSDYSIEKGRIKYQRDESLKAMGDFDSCLGGGPLYKYSFNYRDSNGELKTKSRYGSRFSTPINYELILKSR